MRHITLLFILFIPCFMFAQHKTCGDTYRVKNNRTQTSEFADRFGNYYEREDLINFSRSNRAPMVCGYFELDMASTLSVDQQNTICEVFQYLSTLIGANDNGLPLITITNETILDSNGNPNAGVLATGSPLFNTNSCGIAQNLISQALYGDAGMGLENVSQGIINVNALINNWHNTSNDPFDPQASFYDLYTVILHEALHVLGFASNINPDGSGLNGYYSVWDMLIASSDPSIGSVLVDDPNSACCDGSMLNPNLSFPGDIISGCDNDFFIELDDVLITQINSPYVNPTTQNGSLNYFSHLGGCGDTTNYVMGAGLSTSSIIRALTSQEIEMLYGLGYTQPGSTDVGCNVVANADVFYTEYGDESINIFYNEILENDIASDLAVLGGNIEITFSNDCSVGSSELSLFPASASINIQDLDVGPNQICYTITCGDFCDDGVITIYQSPPYPELDPCTVTNPCEENLFCYGDFEDFTSYGGFGPSSLFAQQAEELECSISPSIGTPDVVIMANGNQFIRIYPLETMMIPLSAPVSPGCKLLVSFDVLIRGSINSVEIYASNESLCAEGLPNNCPPPSPANFICTNTDLITPTPSNLFIDLISCGHPFYPPELDCDFNIGAGYLDTVVDLETIGPFEIENTTSEDLNFIYLTPPDGGGGDVFIDNLVITQTCENELTTNGLTDSEICYGANSANIEVEICLSNESVGLKDIEVEGSLSAAPLLSFVNGQSSIYTTIAELKPGTCEIISLPITLGANLLPGFSFNLSIDIVADNFCGDGSASFSFEMVDCDPSDPCACQIPLSPGMIIAHQTYPNCPIYEGDPGINDPGLMLDEQNYAQDAFCSSTCGTNSGGPQPTSEWFASWKSYCYPNSATIDLGRCYSVRKISIFDTNGRDFVKFYGKCQEKDKWILLSNHYTEAYLSWCPVFESSDGAKMRFIKVVKDGHQSRFSELAICGEPVDDCCEDSRIDPIGDPIGDPLDPRDPWGPIREEDPKGWPWSESDTRGRTSQVYNLEIVPNPARDITWITAPPVGFQTAEIRNITGQLISVFEMDTEATTYRFNTKDLPAGTYLIYMKGKDGLRGIGKLLKL